MVSVTSFSNQNHPCDILKLALFFFTADEDFVTSEDDDEKDNAKIKRENIGIGIFSLFSLNDIVSINVLTDTEKILVGVMSHYDV